MSRRSLSCAILSAPSDLSIERIMTFEQSSDAPSPSVRRPVHFRQTRLAAGLAKRLAAAGIRPNTVSVASSVFSLIAGLLLAEAGRIESSFSVAAMLVAALLMMALRGLCNVLDGMVAIEHGQRTPSGELFNELPDRFSDLFLFVGAGCFDPSTIWLGWTAAALAIITAYVRTLGAAMGAGQNFVGPMQKTHRMAVLAVACMISVPMALFSVRPIVVFRIALAVIAGCCLLTIVIRCRAIIRIKESSP